MFLARGRVTEESLSSTRQMAFYVGICHPLPDTT